MEKEIILYRYERQYPLFYTIEGVNEKIKLIEFKVIRETPSMYVFRKENTMKESRVFKCQLGKRFAYTTKERAFNSFRLRTEKALAYAKQDVKNAEIFLKLIREFNSLTKEDKEL